MPLPSGDGSGIMPVMQVSGTKQLGADLHQWHAGMDAIYAVGSQFYAARSVDISDAQDALRLLEQEHRNRKATKLSRSAVAQLNAVIRNLRHRIDAASARPNPGSCSMRRANPSKPSRESAMRMRAFVAERHAAKLHAEILASLAARNWDVREVTSMSSASEPSISATHPDANFRLWFTKDDILFDKNQTYGWLNAQSIWWAGEDMRSMTLNDVMRRIDQTQEKGRKHQNPSKPKPRTYAVARAGLLAALRDKGWSTQESGATAHATLHHPTDASRDFRVWFGSDGDARSGSGGAVDHYRRATSMHLGDISMISVDHFLEFVDVLVETDRIRRTRQDVGAMRRRHSNPAPRRRNPASKPRTYAIARAQIINALRADGWDVHENLKVPHATHPSGEFRLWFKTQAIYYTTGDRRRGQGSLSDAHSLWIGDIRTMPVEDVLAYIERVRKSSSPRENPSQRQNQQWRRYHEDEAVQAGVIQKDYPLAAHHYDEAAKYVSSSPRLVAYYRKEAEKYRSLAGKSK